MSDLVRRAAWTFTQTFLSVFFIGVPMVINTLQAQGVTSAKQALISLATAAGAAAFSALKTFVVKTV
jgi:hypothetical protein